MFLKSQTLNFSFSAWVMTQRFDNMNDNVESQKASVKIKHHSNIVISPNPAKNQIQIDGIEQIDEMVIYDAFGRVILNEINEAKSSKIINISSFKKGIYFIKFKNNTNGDVKVGKFIVQ